MDASKLRSGDKDRDGHLKAADFLDVENHPTITFTGDQVEVLGANDFIVTGDLTIRGVTRQVPLHVRCLGEWDTPWWEDGEDKGPKRRAGFVGTTTINRHDFGISRDGELTNGGSVVGSKVEITVDAEAILED